MSDEKIYTEADMQAVIGDDPAPGVDEEIRMAVKPSWSDGWRGTALVVLAVATLFSMTAAIVAQTALDNCRDDMDACYREAVLYGGPYDCGGYAGEPVFVIVPPYAVPEGSTGRPGIVLDIHDPEGGIYVLGEPHASDPAGGMPGPAGD